MISAPAPPRDLLGLCITFGHRTGSSGSFWGRRTPPTPQFASCWVSLFSEDTTMFKAFSPPDLPTPRAGEMLICQGLVWSTGTFLKVGKGDSHHGSYWTAFSKAVEQHGGRWGGGFRVRLRVPCLTAVL